MDFIELQQKKISDLAIFYFGFGLVVTGPRIIETERSVGAVVLTSALGTVGGGNKQTCS